MSRLCCGRQDVETKQDTRKLSRNSGDQKLEIKETRKLRADEKTNTGARRKHTAQRGYDMTTGRGKHRAKIHRGETREWKQEGNTAGIN